MRFVAPEAVRIHLANGTDWIEVKKELTVGEEKRYRTRGLKRMSGLVGKDETDDKQVEIDWSELSLARVEAYLVDWSEKRKLSPAAIQALSIEDFEEIDALIQAHIEAMVEEKKQKNPTETSTPRSS